MKNEMSQNLPVKYSAGLVMCEWVKKSTKVQIKCMTVVKGAVDKSFWFGELAPSLKYKKIFNVENFTRFINKTTRKMPGML